MSAYHRYFSPDQVESDQKDVIISQLKAELFELRKSQRNYDSVFVRARNLENHYYDLQEDLDYLRQEVDKETNDGQRQTRYYRIELDVEKERGEERRNHCVHIDGDMNAAKRQLADLDVEETKQIRELKSLEEENEGLQTDIKTGDEESKYLEGAQTRLMRQCGNLEDDFTIGKTKSRELSKRLENVRKLKRNYEEELVIAQDENLELRKERSDNSKYLESKESELTNLRVQGNTFEKEQNVCEARSEENIRELQRQKTLYLEQANANGILYEDLNRLEMEYSKVKTETEGTKDSLRHYENRKGNSMDLRNDYNGILEELRRAIEELTSQNGDILKEFETITEQDEHVRNILNRKMKVDHLKNSTEEKMKKYNINNKTFSTTLSPEHSPYRGSGWNSGYKKY